MLHCHERTNSFYDLRSWWGVCFIQPYTMNISMYKVRSYVFLERISDRTVEKEVRPRCGNIMQIPEIDTESSRKMLHNNTPERSVGSENYEIVRSHSFFFECFPRCLYDETSRILILRFTHIYVFWIFRKLFLSF